MEPNVKSKASNRRTKSNAYDESLPPSVFTSLEQNLNTAIDKMLTRVSLTPWETAVTYKARHLKANLWSKFVGATTVSASDRASAAIAKWLKADTRNDNTNERLFWNECDFGPFKSEDVVRLARRSVMQIIGNAPREEILDGMFSNGASTRVKRGPAATAQKFVGEVHVTSEAWHLFQQYVLPGSFLWDQVFEKGESSPGIVPGSVLFTVPKNTEIDRVACKEPEINMYMQKGVGDFIRQRLLSRRGINLNDQGVNQRFACSGSRFGDLATIDLSSASDLISQQLVRELLPFKWWELLDCIRSKRVLVEDVWYEVSMFSSMGNGFTFELESLLFYCLTRAVCDLLRISGRISVYGDDIILPTRAAPMLGKVFSWFGFIVNTKKSYWRGPFRESCGRHYFGGCDVTPFFIRKPVETQRDLILVLNQLRLWANQQDAMVSYLVDDFREIWESNAKYIPRFLHGGRDVYANTSLVTCDAPRKRLTPITRQVRATDLGAYLHWLRAAERVKASPFALYDMIKRARVRGVTYVGDTEPVDLVTSIVSYDSGKVKLARNRSWDRGLSHCQMWPTELI